MTRDPVTPELRIEVFSRDKMCVAPMIDYFCSPCGGRLTLDHVQEGYGRMGKRAPSDAAHLVTLCYTHHLGSEGWATSHKSELRDYLRTVNASANEDTISMTRPTSRLGEDIGHA